MHYGWKMNDRVCHRCGHLCEYHESVKCTWPGCTCEKLVGCLTQQESKIVRLWAMGVHTTKDVANVLEIATKTVDAHAYNIYKKTRMSTKFNIVMAFVKAGQLSLNDFPDLPVNINLLPEVQNELTAPIQRSLSGEPHCAGDV